MFPTLAWPEALRRRRAVPAMLATDAAPPWRRFAGRLLWQEVRHARRLVLVLLVVGVPLCLFGRQGGLLPDFAVFVLFTPLLLGLWSFRNEQVMQQFRFLAQRGIPGEAVWLSKQAVWLRATILLTLALTGATLAGPAMSEWLPTCTPPDAETTPFPVAALPLFVLGTYAIGQFVSLLIARTIVAGFIGAILTAALVTWLSLLIWLRVPLVWCVAPILVLLLLATLLRVSDWLIERNTWRGWARVLACPALAGALVFAAFVLYRIYEIPASLPIPAVVNAAEAPPPLTTAEAQTIRLYEQALAAMNDNPPPPEEAGSGMGESDLSFLEKQPAEAPESNEEQKTWQDGWRHATPSEREWLDEHQPALELLLSAAEIEDGALTDPRRLRFGDWNPDIVNRVYRLANLALLSARRLESQQEFDAALERYAAVLRMAQHMARRGGLLPGRAVAGVLLSRVYQAIPLWAAHSGQMPERIRRAIELLQEEGRRFPELSRSVAASHVELRGAIVEESEALWIAESGRVLTPVLVASRFFWERERALRVLDALAVRAIQLAEHIETLLQSRGVELSEFVRDEVVEDESGPFDPQWLETTPLLMNPDVSPQWDWALLGPIDTAARRHAAELQLALIAWRLEHGELPESLDRLAPGYFELLPLDPWSGRPFGYQPVGFSSALDTQQGAAVPAGQPLLWSGGMANSRVVETVSPAGARVHRAIASNGATHSTLLTFPISAISE